MYAYTFGGIKFSLEPSNVVMLFAVCKMGHAWHNGKNIYIFFYFSLENFDVFNFVNTCCHTFDMQLY